MFVKFYKIYNENKSDDILHIGQSKPKMEVNGNHLNCFYLFVYIKTCATQIRTRTKTT